jgi:hypothetical protein
MNQTAIQCAKDGIYYLNLEELKEVMKYIKERKALLEERKALEKKLQSAK